jgi:hypothetical protein
VDAFYKAAMAAGASDNGAPGLRPHYHAHYYAAFVRDPDGHNIEAVTHTPPGAKAAGGSARAKAGAAKKRKARPSAKKAKAPARGRRGAGRKAARGGAKRGRR